MASKEYFPLEYWKELQDHLLNSDHVELAFKKNKIDDADSGKMAKELEKIFMKASGEVQASSQWEEAREAIGFQHRVDLSFTPSGVKKTIHFPVDMSLAKVGLEEKIIGKSPQAVPFRLSFNVKKLPAGHPLSFTSGRNTSGEAIIRKVYKSPFSLPSLKNIKTANELENQIVQLLRSVPFAMAGAFNVAVKGQKEPDDACGKILEGCRAFLEDYAKFPKWVDAKVLKQISLVGPAHDAEVKLAFLMSIYEGFKKSRGNFVPAAYLQIVIDLFKGIFEVAVCDVMEDIQRQQEKINSELHQYAEVDQERARLKTLVSEMESLKKRGASGEVVRKSRNEALKVKTRLDKILQRHQTDLGIILMQELYIDKLHQLPDLKEILDKQADSVKAVKSGLQANHLSVNRDMDSLVRALGLHASHLLVQHAIYNDVEPDMDKVVSLDSISTYSLEELASVMSLIPTLQKELEGQKEISSTTLLKSTLKCDLPDGEKKAFEDYVTNNPQPKNNNTQRFNEQLGQFMKVSSLGKGMDNIEMFLEKELKSIQAVVRFAGMENKLNADFKNHMMYYSKLFVDPYLELLEESMHKGADDLGRARDKLYNGIKSQLKIKYSVAEERSLLSMFKHVNAQLQNEDLFSPHVFARQIKNFISTLNGHKGKVAHTLMKKIVTTFTVFMMGYSRNQTLSSTNSGFFKSADLADVRKKGRSLVED